MKCLPCTAHEERDGRVLPQLLLRLLQLRLDGEALLEDLDLLLTDHLDGSVGPLEDLLHRVEATLTTPLLLDVLAPAGAVLLPVAGHETLDGALQELL